MSECKKDTSGWVVRAMVDVGKTARSSKWALRWFYGQDLSNGWGSQRGKRSNVCVVIRNSEVKEGRRV